MITPANRVNAIQEYYFSRKLREVSRLKSEGHDIISLAIGGPDLPPSPNVINTLATEARRPDVHGYQPTTGPGELRQAWAGWYRRWYGVEADPASEIQPLTGSKEGVILISLTFLNPGDKVLIPDPGYPTYSSASKLAGAEIINYDLTEASGWQPDFNQLEQIATRNKIKLMWVNYPHMPTGTPADMQVMTRIVNFARRHGIVIAHDNPYSFILHKQPVSIMQIQGANGICIEMNSLSKSHNMPGWRMGVMLSNPEFISWAVKVKSNMESGQFLPMMKAAIEALDAPRSWYQNLNTIYAGRRKIAEQIMAAMGCTFSPQQGGLFLWGRIPDEYADSFALADEMLYQHNIFITPGAIFGSNGNRYIRISLCSPTETLNRALQRLIK